MSSLEGFEGESRPESGLDCGVIQTCFCETVQFDYRGRRKSTVSSWDRRAVVTGERNRSQDSVGGLASL